MIPFGWFSGDLIRPPGTSPIGRGKFPSSARCGGHLYIIVQLPLAIVRF